MTSSNSLVSVIITAYNRVDFLAEAIASVLRQSYQNLQVMVVDDGSVTDDIRLLCEKFPEVDYLRKENGGLSSARNFGIAHAKGEFVCFLDDDDAWKPEKVEVQLQAFKNFPEAQMIHGSALVIDEKGERTGTLIGASVAKAHKRSGYVFWNALGIWVPKSPTVMIRKAAFNETMRFDQTIKVGEDIDFYQRFFYLHPVRYIAEPLAYYRQYDQPDRLSQQRKKYLGIGLKMMGNFKAMGLSGTFLMARISRRLLKMEIQNYKLANPQKPLRIPSWKLWLYPGRTLKQYFSAQ